MKNSFLGETRLHFLLPLVPSSKCILPRAMVSPRSNLAVASARNGPRLVNALLVTTALGQKATLRRTGLVAGALHLLRIAVAHQHRQAGKRGKANIRLMTTDLSLLQLASEENLLQAKLIDLLALGT